MIAEAEMLISFLLSWCVKGSDCGFSIDTGDALADGRTLFTHSRIKSRAPEETRLFLVTHGQNADLEATIQTFVNLVLGQRSRETRMTIAEIIRARLVRWNPPAWVLQDLVSFANAGSLDVLRAALLLHVPRQDHLLYDFAQAVIVPRWQQGESEITIAHAQTFFDMALEEHPETARWGFETRLRLARGLLDQGCGTGFSVPANHTLPAACG